VVVATTGAVGAVASPAVPPPVCFSIPFHV